MIDVRIWGMIVIKGVASMKIIGTEQEIEWVKNTLMNSCMKCPYMESCNRVASEDQKNTGRSGIPVLNILTIILSLRLQKTIYSI